ncbi:hypothetical protein D3C86_2034600 [compost metagenome]
MRANTSTNSGANQYSGMAMKDCVTVVINLSVLLPCFRAATIPKGSDTSTAVPKATNTRLRVMPKAGSTWSTTGVLLIWDKPISPVKKSPSQRRY